MKLNPQIPLELDALANVIQKESPSPALVLGATAVRERISRRARRIRIEMRPDGEVVLTIPHRASRAAAYQFLDRSRAWLTRQRARLLSRPLQADRTPLRWDGSDCLPLRGAAVSLRVESVAGRSGSAQVDPQGITLRVPARWRSDEARLTRLLLNTFKAEARRDALQLLDLEADRLGLNYSGLNLRDPRARWGSCGADGRIMLSLRLVMAPPEVFRYVVIHELCHLRWRSHGPRFWALVARQMPEYQQHRVWLRREGETLLAWELR